MVRPRLDSLTKARKLDQGWTVGLRLDHQTKVGQSDQGQTVGLRLDHWTKVQMVQPRSDRGGGQKGQTEVRQSDHSWAGPMVQSTLRSLGFWGL